MAQPTPPTPYRAAWRRGAEGKGLTPAQGELADADPLVDQANDAGRSGVAFEDFLREHGLTPAPAAARAGRQGSDSLLSRGVERATGGRTGSLGSVLLGFVLAALALSVIQEGPKGPLLWFKAKFLNDASGSAKNVSPSSGSGTTGGPSGAPQTPLGPAGPLAGP